MNVKIYIFLVVLIVFSAACNNNKFMKLADIPIPNGVTEQKIDGAYEATLDNVSNGILTSIKKDHANVDDKMLTVSNDANWEKVGQFYATILSEKGFTKNDSGSSSGKNHRVLVFENKSMFASETVAIALIEVGDEKKMRFVNLFYGK